MPGNLKRINVYFPEDVAEDLEALQKRYYGIPISNVVLIALRRLADLELRQAQVQVQAQTTPPERSEEVV
jgi:hypothetical protein